LRVDCPLTGNCQFAAHRPVLAGSRQPDPICQMVLSTPLLTIASVWYWAA
jgi:hypothetical protein